jgi:hypothetical protein
MKQPDLFSSMECMELVSSDPLPHQEAGASTTSPSKKMKATRQMGLSSITASLSARQAKEAGLLTSGTYGPRSTGSLSSAALASCLANRLRQRTDLLGSTLFNLTWKERVTPAQRSIFALRASARRTSGSGCIGSHWITPQTHDTTTRGNTMADHHYSPHDLSNQVALASWPTPTSKFKAGGEYKDPDKAMARAMGPHANDLRDFAQLASWPTPNAQDAKAGQSQVKGRKQVSLPRTANWAGWPTPRQADGEKNVRTLDGTLSEIERKGGPQDLCQGAVLTGWPTPMAGTPKTDNYNEAGNTDSSRKTVALCGANIAGSGITPDPNWTGPARLTASGEIRIGSFAGMESGGQLRPGHSRWLMGCRAAWETSAPNYDDWRKWQDFLASLSEAQRRTVSEVSAATATRSTMNKRRPSSTPRSGVGE